MERRLEILTFVAPLLEHLGPRLTMREAARAAHVSIGTLYYYFPSKRELLLYGLNQEAVPYLCRRFAIEHAQLRAADPAGFRAAFVEFVVETLAVMRASVDSAMRLGPAITRDRIDRVIHAPLPDFMELIRQAMPDANRSESVEPLVRRLIAAALLERELSPDLLRRQLEVILADRGQRPGGDV